MLLIDAHVHIHDCYDPVKFFEHAYDNLKASAVSASGSTEFTGVLMLAESAGEDNFNRFGQAADLTNSQKKLGRYGTWFFTKTDEDNSIIVSDGERKLILIAGHQISAAEDLEVLMLGTTEKIQDGLSIFDLLDKARDLDALRVIPWGAGKWLFSRGELLKRIIDSMEANDFFLGDEGGRPIFWPTPRHFNYAARKGIRNLPGTDPLPFPWEVNRAGTFGCLLQAPVDWAMPAVSILNAIRNPDTTFNCFGKLETPFRFFHNQFKMQKRKRAKAYI